MRRRPGFTLLELMIVVSIFVVLIGLLLPALNSARETARRAQCGNNLGQLGIAIGSYASTHSVLPPGVVNDTGPIRNLPSGYHHSWVVQILPFIGQQNIYNHFDLWKSVYDPANDTVAEIKIATLLCPDDPWDAIVDYAGCHHDAIAAIDSDNHGVLYLNSKVRYDEINDGLSYTILLGEIAGEGLTLGWVSGTSATLRNTGARLTDQDALVGPARPLLSAPGQRPRGELFAIVEEAAVGLWPADITGGFASSHPVSCNFLFCDGSVRSLKYTVEERVYRLLGNRADGEPISSDTY